MTKIVIVPFADRLPVSETVLGKPHTSPAAAAE